MQITCPASVPTLRPQHCRIENAIDRYASWDCLEKPCIYDSGMTRARVGVEAAVACGLNSAFQSRVSLPRMTILVVDVVVDGPCVEVS